MHPDARQSMWSMVLKLWILGLGLAIPATLLAVRFMPELIRLVLGPQYDSSTTAAQIILISIPSAVVGGPLLAYLIAAGRRTDTTVAFVAAFIAAVLLHSALDWWLGAVGGAIASGSRDAVNAVVAGALVWRARAAMPSGTAAIGGTGEAERRSTASAADGGTVS
jgi:O-antigen/teichoic acid export membrane protein